MPQVEQSLDIYQNANETIMIAVKDDNGDPMDLTLATGICWILSKGDTEVARYDLTDTELAIAAADSTDDGIQIELPSAVTGALTLGKLYRHQAWATINAKSKPVSEGDVTVLRGDGC